jgi:hypothetical protein
MTDVDLALAGSWGRLIVALDDLGKDVPATLTDDETPGTALTLLGMLRQARKDLQSIEGYVEGVAAGRMEGQVFDGPGVHAIRHQTAERTTWLHEDLATAVAVSAMVDRETGELPSEEAQIVGSNVKAAICSAGAFSYWRVGVLKKAGIDVSDFRTRTPGRWTVEVELGVVA